MKKRLLTLLLIIGAALFVYTKIDKEVSDQFNKKNSASLLTKSKRMEIEEKDFQNSEAESSVETPETLTNAQKNSKKEYSKPSMVRDEAIFVSLSKGDNTLLISYLENNGNPNLKSEEGVSLLSASAMNGDLKAVDYLVKSGADVNRQDNNGTTPVMSAIMSSTAEGEYNEIIDDLIEAGADLNMTDNTGLTPVHMAVEINNPKILEKLLVSGGKQVKLPGGLSPMMMAAVNGSTNVIPVLAKHGGQINEQGPKGETALMLAAGNSNFPEVRMLVAMGSKENMKDKTGRTASDYAAATNNELIKAFLSDER